MESNFSVCPHCKAKGLRGILLRLNESTPVIARSNGKSFHLFLFDGPNPMYGPTGAPLANRIVGSFRYAHDIPRVTSAPVDVVLTNPGETLGEVVKQLEAVADELARLLEVETKLGRVFDFDGMTLIVRS